MPKLLFEIYDLLFQSMNFHAKCLKILVNLACFHELALSLVCVAKSEISIHILWIFVDWELERLYSFVVFGTNIEQDTIVVKNHTVSRVKFDSFFIVVKCFIKTSLSLRVYTNILENSRFRWRLLCSLEVVFKCLRRFTLFLKNDAKINLSFIVLNQAWGPPGIVFWLPNGLPFLRR